MNYGSLLILILGFVTKYAYSLEPESIVGGDEATEGQFKYQVSIEACNDSFCGGGIIGDQHVLTAAHCVINTENGNFYGDKLTVLANSIVAKAEFNPNIVRIDVEKIYVLKAYQPERPMGIRGKRRIIADIAVLKLIHKLGLCKNSNLAALSLPQPRNDAYWDYVGKSAIIAGYGYNRINVKKEGSGEDVEYEGESDNFLRYGKADVIPNVVCEETKDIPIYITHLCAQIEQRDSKVPEGVCTGDSGSPLVYDGTTVIGVLSSSPNGCNEDTSPGVYTRVSSYLDFIQDAMDDKNTFDMRISVLSTYNTPKRQYV